MNKCKCENCNCNKMENKVLNQLYKTITYYGKTLEEIEKNIAILQRDSHPPVKDLEKRVKKLELKNK